MGINSKKAPPLPAPTEESTTTSELEPTPTDVSKPGDEKSTYSLPEDGTPVTIKTRGKNNKQTSLLIEYSDHPKNGAPGAEGDRRPSVRVRVTTPSGKGKDGGGRVRITEAADFPNTSSYSRRPLSPLTPSHPAPFKDGEDNQSIGSYASATEESNVSRNQPIDIGIDIGRAGRRPRRPASPLIPQGDDTMGGSHLPSTVQSEISAIPTDSFLDGSGPTRSSESKWASSPSSTDKLKNTKTRTVSRERVKISSSDKKDRSDRKHKSSKSRTSSASDRYGDEPKSTRRRSSRNHESAVAAADSSVLSSNLSPSHRSMDQHSMRSESSSKSINNPKLLEAVEDAIRRLILPQLDSLRRETSLRESARRGSVVSTGTSISREDLLADRRKPSDRSRDPRYKDRRDREGRHDYADASPRAFDRDSIDGSSLLDVEPQTPRRKSGDAFKAAAATAAVGGLTAAALAGSPSDDKKQRRRKRAESVRSRSRASDYTDDFDDDDHLPAPPMPLMSEINPSEVTRTSILSADTDRPHSATEEASAAVRQIIRPVGSTDSSTPTPTKTPNIAQDGLSTQHANISHGDLTALRNKRDSDSSGHQVAYTRVPPPMDDHPLEELDDVPDSNYMGSAYDYYNTQDVPPPLRYEPYQPERRGLSPIYSVSGYTEAGSEGPQHRDSRTFAPNEDSPEKTSQRDLSMHSPASAHSNVMGRESDLRSDDRSSVADHRHTMSVDGSDLDTSASRQAVRGIGANPDIVDVPVGLESHVASLVDGSMVDQSVLSQDYGPRDSTISYGDGSRSYVDDRSSPTKQSVDSRHYIEDERSITPTARNPQQRSREFTEEYDLDKYGRKIPRSQYRQSPTESEAAITAGAAAKAIKALKANQGRQPSAAEIEYEETFVPAGVQRNRSFKERTLAGHELATTPTHSVDRLDYANEAPKLGASGLPDLDDPMPEIGYMDESDTHTNASVVKERLDGAADATTWAHRSLQSTPKPHEMTREGTQGESDERHGLGITDMATAAALGAGAAMAASQSRQPSNDRDEDWHRTSDDRKRDTLGTNPFEGISPVANPQLGDNLYGGANYDIGFHTGSPGGPLEDEGYKSQGPNRTPEFQHGGQDGMDAPKAIELHDGVDPFYEPPKSTATRHLSGMSHGMATPLYDAATGGGIDRIESKDIVALMQELVARDAQRTARDTEIAATVMFLAKEMRVSFRSVEDRIRQAEDVLADELQETEKAIVKTIGGPRPYPGSAGRSAQTSQVGEDIAVKKGNIIRRALKGLRTTGTNDLTRIEDMLLTLLKDVDDLKAQTAQQSRSTTRPSLDNLQPDIPYEQDPGYEPEGRDAASLASQPTQSGRLSTSQSRPLQRQYSENRVSTVPEANEDEDDLHHQEPQHERNQPDEFGSGGRYSNTNLLTPGQSNQRGSSVPLDTPPQTSHAAAQSGSLSNDNTPRTEKGKKHKSSSSSSWIPKISRWSETTASTVSKAFRGSATSRKDRDAEYMHPGHSRSGSDLAAYADDYYRTDPYGEDYLHTGHSDPALAAPGLNQPDPDQPRLYMTPEDPKYKAHRNSLNLQHPQPRAGQTERFKANLESQAYIYDSTMTPRSQDWQGSTTSLQRVPAQHGQRYSDVSGAGGEYWDGSANGPPRPPKEPLDAASGTPRRSAHASKPSKTSPLPYHSVESGYGTATATHTNYTGSPKPENRNLSAALGVPSRRPSGPRAMTPKSAEEEAAREERRRKRDTFGTVASQESETF